MAVRLGCKHGDTLDWSIFEYGKFFSKSSNHLIAEHLFVLWAHETIVYSCMALSKKGSRLIEVDGQNYRWKVSACDEPGLGVVVELAEQPAQRMVMWVDHGNVVSPKLVRYAISEGQERGWVPEKPGPVIEFRIEADLDI